MNADNKNLSILCEDCIKPMKSIEGIAKKHGVDVSEVESALEKGISIEMEHTEDRETAKIIASHHLDEMIDYYDELAKIED